MASDPRTEGRVLDAGALKALAHPLRFQLVELLIELGPSTASELGRQVGESSGSTSYHLRQLAKQGLIEEAPDLGTARDRYWRAVRGGGRSMGSTSSSGRRPATTRRPCSTRSCGPGCTVFAGGTPTRAAGASDWVSSTVEMTGRFRLTRRSSRR
jgi:DNA-binding transcriptional ArsR family regulator